MDLGAFLIDKIKKKRNINLFLSGGKSPLKYYKKLSQSDVNFKKTNLFIVDERNTKKKFFSNFFNVCKSLKDNKELLSKIYPLNLRNYKKIFDLPKIIKLKKYYTISILGMGEDGHFASIFRNSKKFDDLVNLKEKPKYILTEPIGNPFMRRITMNLSAIMLSNKIILILNSKKKVKLFKKIMNKNNTVIYPIYYLLKKAKNKMIICEKDKFKRLSLYKKI